MWTGTSVMVSPGCQPDWIETHLENPSNILTGVAVCTETVLYVPVDRGGDTQLERGKPCLVDGGPRRNSEVEGGDSSVCLLLS